MSERARACPGCGGAMISAGKGRAPLFLCRACGGTWAEGPSLEAAGVTAADFEPFEGGNERTCATCREPLSCAFLQGIPVERCVPCSSVYLDAGELEQLGPELWRDRIEGEADAGRAGQFACARCGTRHPYARGHATASGLVCDLCVPLPQTTQREREEANSPRRDRPQPGWFSTHDHRSRGLDELLRDAWDMFRGPRMMDRDELLARRRKGER